jgi:hypothetical protein
MFSEKTNKFLDVLRSWSQWSVFDSGEMTLIQVGRTMSNVISTSLWIWIRPMAVILCFGSGFTK